MYEQKLTYIQPINLLHHSSLNFLGNYFGFTLHHTSLNLLPWISSETTAGYYTILLWISLETTKGWSPYTILPWISLKNSPGSRRGTNNKVMSPWPIILLLLVLMDSKRSCPCTWSLSFLFSFFFLFSIFLLISKIFKKKICCWKENRIYTGKYTYFQFSLIFSCHPNKCAKVTLDFLLFANSHQKTF